LDIGGMEEGLFISYVDTEWCIRATMKGYQLYGVGCAGMIHDLGDDVSHFFGQTVPIYSPLRYYYTFRNSVWLIRCDWVPIEWKIVSIKRSMVFYIVYSLFLGRRFANWKMMMRGLWHGVKGKDGIIR
jgi:rhamnosyltransferase